MYYVFGGGSGLEGELTAPFFVSRNKNRCEVVPLSYCAWFIVLRCCKLH